MATALEPPRTKQKLEEPADADVREDTDGVLKAESGQAPSVNKSTPFTCSWHVDFPTEEAAAIVYKTLSVDPELRPYQSRYIALPWEELKSLNPTKVFREVRVGGKRLFVSFASAEERLLRVAVNGFKDMQKLAIRTLEEFGADLMKAPS